MYKTAVNMSVDEFKLELERINHKVTHFYERTKPSRQNRTYLKAELRKLKVKK
jgi:hypothetical protein